MMHDTLDRTKSLVSWSPNGETPSAPLALAQMSGALAILGDRSRATDSMESAVRTVMTPHVVDWWVAWSYWSNLRDARASSPSPPRATS